MKGTPLINRAASLSSRKPYGKWREKGKSVILPFSRVGSYDFGTRESFWKGKSVILPFSRDGSCDFGVSLSFECALRKSLDNFGRSSVILWKRESS